MKSVANMLFDYAVEKNIVSANISRSVHGVCLNFAPGLRVGEHAAPKFQDFSEASVEICGQEIKDYYEFLIKRRRRTAS